MYWNDFISIRLVGLEIGRVQLDSSLIPSSHRETGTYTKRVYSSCRACSNLTPTSLLCTMEDRFLHLT